MWQSNESVDVVRIYVFPSPQSDSLVLYARTLDVAGMYMVTRVSITRKQAIYTVWKSTRNAFGTMRVIIMSTD